MLKMDGVDLSFEPEALTRVAEIALDRKTGARGLRGVLESVMTDIMFRIPSDKTVTSSLSRRRSSTARRADRRTRREAGKQSGAAEKAHAPHDQKCITRSENHADRGNGSCPRLFIPV